jgi:hypothetical protein
VTATERASPSWNPLRCDGTPLPPGCLLAAKILALSFFRADHFVSGGPPFLPFLSVLDTPAIAPWLPHALAIAFHVAFALLMFNRMVQRACLAIAVCMIVHIAAHRLAYANNVLFVTVFLLLVGLYHPRTGLLPLRVQIAFVYGGAAVNKAFDPDWWNGRFFDTLMGEALLVDWYRSVAASWRPGWLGSALGAATIATEAAIAAAVLFLRDGRAGVLLMVGFHLVMLAATDGRLSVPFLYGAFAVSTAFFYAPLDIPALRSRPRLSRMVTPALWWLGAMLIQWPRVLTLPS